MKSKYKIKDFESLQAAKKIVELEIQEDKNYLKDLGIKGVAVKAIQKDLLPEYDLKNATDWRQSACQILLDFGYQQLSDWLLNPKADDSSQWKSNLKGVLDVLYQQNRKDLAQYVYDYIYGLMDKKNE